MKYKVGDKVMVRSDLVGNNFYGEYQYPCEYSMTLLRGKELVITHAYSEYYIANDEGKHMWVDEMLEDVEEEFKLPEDGRWCVKATKENINILGDYWDKGCGLHKVYSYEDTIRNDVGKYWCSYNLSSGNLLFSDSPGSNHIIKEKPNGLLEITFDQFKKYVLKESESTPVKEDVKFEVGKWYKYSAEYINRKTYAKYSSNQNVGGRFYYDEIITENNGFKKGHNWSILTCNPVLLTDLSEIQQYLPENHPDKIKRKTKKVEDLKYPDAVHCSSKEQHDKVKQFANIRDYEGNYYYLIGAGGRREKPWDGTCGSNPESRTTYTRYEFSAIIFPEEKVEIKHKLSKEELLAEAKRRYPVGTKYKCANGILALGAEECFEITHGDELRFFDDSKQKIDAIGRGFVYYVGSWAEIISEPTVEEEVIDVPEYIECIEGFSDYIIPGLIYKVIDKTHVNSIILRCNITSNLSAGSNLYVSVWSFAFKPSTKEAFEKQSKSSVKEKEELVQTGLSQSQACDSCKYNDNCGEKGFFCNAHNGQHYPKDSLSERYIVAVDQFDTESSSSGIEVGRLPLDRGMGFYEQMSKMSMQVYAPYFSENLGGLPNIKFVGDSGSDEIYVPIIKTEVKQIKL